MFSASNGYFPLLSFKWVFFNLILLAKYLLKKPLIKNTYNSFKFLLDILKGINVYHLYINKMISKSIFILVFNISKKTFNFSWYL